MFLNQKCSASFSYVRSHTLLFPSVNQYSLYYHILYFYRKKILNSSTTDRHYKIMATWDQLVLPVVY